MMFNSDSKPTEPSKIAGAAPQSDPDPNLLKLKRSRPLPSGMHQAGRQAGRENRPGRNRNTQRSRLLKCPD